MQQPKRPSPLIVALIVIALIGIATTAIVIAKKSNDDQATQQVESETQSSASTATAASDTSVVYKDGTYTQVGRYISPGGAESIDVTVTIANDMITTASVSGNASRGDAKEYQDAFVSGFKNSVVGKDIDTVSLTRTAGASLTSNGFNAALELIKADAQA